MSQEIISRNRTTARRGEFLYVGFVIMALLGLAMAIVATSPRYQAESTLLQSLEAGTVLGLGVAAVNRFTSIRGVITIDLPLFILGGGIGYNLGLQIPAHHPIHGFFVRLAAGYIPFICALWIGTLIFGFKKPKIDWK